MSNKILNYIYEINLGLFNVLNIKHNYGINFAISSNQNPSSNDILLSIETSSGITINTSAHVENNLTIGGNLIVGTTDILTAITDLQNNPSGSNVDLTNYYTKQEIISTITNFIYEFQNAFFIKKLYIKHPIGINFYVNNVTLITLIDNYVQINVNTNIQNNLTIGGSLTVGTTNIVSEIDNIKTNY